MLRFMNRFLISTVAVLTLVISVSGSLRADEDDAKQLIVMIERDLGFGAGIIFGARSDRLYIATANHVVHQGMQRLAQVQIRLMSLPGQEVEAEVLRDFDRNLDLAVLSVPNIEELGIQVDEILLHQLGAPDELARGDEVFTIGNPRGVGWQANVDPDRISGKDALRLTFESLLIAKGHSGGGLFNKDWGLVGMITADQPPNGIAVRIDRVLEQLRKWGYPVALDTLAQPKPDQPSTTLSILSSKSGHVWFYPGGQPEFLPLTYYGFRIGVTRTEDLPPAGESLSFFSFDVSRFRDKRILRAELDLMPRDTIGDPYGTLGSLMIDQISFGDRSQVLAAKPMTNRDILLDPPQGPIDVMHQVKTSIETGAQNVQFRIRFSAARLSDVNKALMASNAYLYWKYGPKLTVYYEE